MNEKETSENEQNSVSNEVKQKVVPDEVKQDAISDNSENVVDRNNSLGSLVSRREELFTFLAKTGFPGTDVSDKITSEHITQIINNEDKESERRSKDRREIRIFLLIILIIVLIALTVYTILLKSQPDLLKYLITAVCSLAAGAFGGYGFGYSRGKSKSHSDD